MSKKLSQAELAYLEYARKRWRIYLVFSIVSAVLAVACLIMTFFLSPGDFSFWAVVIGLAVIVAAMMVLGKQAIFYRKEVNMYEARQKGGPR